MRIIKNFVAGSLFVLLLLVGSFGFAGTQSVRANSLSILAKSCSPGKGAPGASIFVPWYKYLDGEEVDGHCHPVLPKSGGDNIDVSKTVTLVLIAIIELLTRLAGLISVGFIIWGGIQYVISQGEPEHLKSAKDTITNALVGFVVVVLAIALVQFIGRAFST